MNGAESLVRTLLASGIDTCFANPGTSEMHFVAALDRVAGMRCVLGLAETIVSGCADGYARMAEKPAATLTHCGPGFANSIANVHNARRAGEHVRDCVGRGSEARLARIGEKRGRRFRTDENDVPGAGQHLQRVVHDVGNAVHRRSAAPARHARHLRGRAQVGAARVRHPIRRVQPGLAQRLTGQNQHRWLAAAQHLGDRAQRVGSYCGASWNGQGRADLTTLVPRGVGWQDQSGDLPGRTQRSLRGGGAIRADAS